MTRATAPDVSTSKPDAYRLVRLRCEEIRKEREMTDQELLELAAKAVGLSFASQNVTSHGVYCNDATWWNPLTDDGDALRLAVKLQMEVAIFEAECHTRCVEGWQQDWFVEVGDPYAATRRAIVKAAAEIGKARR